jgi:hypothetical protein
MQVKRTVKLVTEQSVMYVIETLMCTTSRTATILSSLKHVRFLLTKLTR